MLIELQGELVVGFLLGLLSSTHCIGMCGGLISALTMAISKDSTKSGKTTLILFYNLGRLSSYFFLGGLVGVINFSIIRDNTPITRALSGIILVLMGLYLVGISNFVTRVEIIGKKVWVYIQSLCIKKIVPVSNPLQALFLGMVWGWLPCGLVYTTLVWAASHGSGLKSALLMLSFGTGTMPALLFTSFTFSRLKLFKIRTLGGSVVILYGAWMIFSTLMKSEIF